MHEREIQFINTSLKCDVYPTVPRKCYIMKKAVRKTGRQQGLPIASKCRCMVSLFLLAEDIIQKDLLADTKYMVDEDVEMVIM